ncbi:MAG TPA: flagellar motor switch protein FliN [Leptolinea sp.]
MNDEFLQSQESTDGQAPGMDALQESINAVLENSAASTAASSNNQSQDEPAEDKPTQINNSAINVLMDVNLLFTVELGRTQMSIKNVLELQKGSVVELDRVAGEAVDIFVNDHLMARGEVVVVDDKFGVRITELVAPETKE